MVTRITRSSAYDTVAYRSIRLNRQLKRGCSFLSTLLVVITHKWFSMHGVRSVFQRQNERHAWFPVLLPPVMHFQRPVGRCSLTRLFCYYIICVFTGISFVYHIVVGLQAITTRSSAPRCDTSYLMPKGVMMFICWLPLYSRNIRRRADVFDDLARSICSTRQANGGRHVPHWVVNCPTEVVSCIRSLRCASSRFMLRHRASTSATIRRCIFEGGFCPTYRILYS